MATLAVRALRKERRDGCAGEFDMMSGLERLPRALKAVLGGGETICKTISRRIIRAAHNVKHAVPYQPVV